MMLSKLGLFLVFAVFMGSAPLLSEAANGGGAASMQPAPVAQSREGTEVTLKRALLRIAASKADNNTLIKAVLAQDERSARSILARYHYTPSTPFKIAFGRGGSEPAADDVVRLAALMAPHFYGDPEPGWVGMVKIGGRWVDWNNWNPIGCCWEWR